MKPFLSPSGPTLFQDRNVFEFDLFLNNSTTGRTIASAPAMPPSGSDDDRPRNVVLRGAPGTGKTTCVEMISQNSRTVPAGGPRLCDLQDRIEPLSILSRIYFCLFGHALLLRWRCPGYPGKNRENPDGREEVMIVCFDDAIPCCPIRHQFGPISPPANRREISGANLGIVASVSSIETRPLRTSTLM